MQALRVLTWHVHGNYMWYLSHVPCEWYLPVRRGRPPGYGGRSRSFPWPDNVHEVDADDVHDLDVDCVLYQSHDNWLRDRHELLSPTQRRLPRVFLEHDPPREHPTDTRHPVDDPYALVVHVTAFNDLMWDTGRTPTTVIEHGVWVPPEIQATGALERGVVVVNNIALRGRRTGFDVYRRAARAVPLDLVGMGSREAGGLGEIANVALPRFVADFRFLFNPTRYTSLGLSILEAMHVGLPVVGLATTELVTVVRNGVHGYLETDVDRLVGHMRRLLADRELAAQLGENARALARARFGIERFAGDWYDTLTRHVGGGVASVATTTG